MTLDSILESGLSVPLSIITIFILRMSAVSLKSFAANRLKKLIITLTFFM